MSTTTKYADEGTIAHALAAMCFAEKKPTTAYVGRLISSDDYEHATLAPSNASRWMVCAGSHALETKIKFKPRRFSHQVDDEMAANVQIYLDRMAKYAADAGPEAEDMCEVEVPVDHITGERGEKGTADRAILNFAKAEIQAHDLKYGRGVEVFAEDNEQLAMYLSGLRVTYEEFAPPGGWKTFRGFIHQPRINAEHPYEHVWTAAELRAFEEQAQVKAQRARLAKREYSEIVDNGEVMRDWEKEFLVAGEEQCKFCDAKATCPAAKTLVTDTVLAEFVDLDKHPITSVGQLVAIPADNAKLARLRSMTPFIRAWCDAVDAHTEAEILNGRPVPGFKAVAGRRGNRAWRDEEVVEAAMKAMRLKHDTMYKYSVISPTVAEERLKKDHPKLWKKLLEHVTQAEGSPTVVPESDKRPAIDIKPVIDEFSVLPDIPLELPPEDLV